MYRRTFLGLVVLDAVLMDDQGRTVLSLIHLLGERRLDLTAQNSWDGSLRFLDAELISVVAALMRCQTIGEQTTK